MLDARPSLTARGAAAHRAVHQTAEGGAIFRDPFALSVLDDETRATVEAMAADPATRPMRLFISARSRFSEDALAAAVAAETRQVVILGAGLDTFALRNPFADEGVRVFEVDYPATQAWKWEQFAARGIAMPAALSLAPVDFERDSIADGLIRAGFRMDRPAFFQWLGVTPYLTRNAISVTLVMIAGIAGSSVVFDYVEPFEAHPVARRARLMQIAERAAARGEPWRSFFKPNELVGFLRDRGLDVVEDLGLEQIAARFYGPLTKHAVAGPGGHLLWARSS